MKGSTVPFTWVVGLGRPIKCGIGYVNLLKNTIECGTFLSVYAFSDAISGLTAVKFEWKN